MSPTLARPAAALDADRPCRHLLTAARVYHVGLETSPLACGLLPPRMARIRCLPLCLSAVFTSTSLALAKAPAAALDGDRRCRWSSILSCIGAPLYGAMLETSQLAYGLLLPFRARPECSSLYLTRMPPCQATCASYRASTAAMIVPISPPPSNATRAKLRSEYRRVERVHRHTAC